MQPTDEQLLKKARTGNAMAFSDLLAPHEAALYRVALSIVTNPEDAKDCTQEAMLRMFRAIKTFDGKAKFTTWAYRVVTNACLDHLRRQKVRASSSLDELQQNGLVLPDNTQSPDDRLLMQERMQALQFAIAQLPNDLRIALVLRDVQGLSYDEVAEVTGGSLGTIKSRIHRAREKLRSLLQKEPELFGSHTRLNTERREGEHEQNV